MRFLRRRAKTAGTPVGEQAAGPAPEDRAEWSGPPAVADRACCCPARPLVRVLIPPAPARPHSVDLLLCGHHYRACRAGLTAAHAVVIDDRRGGETHVGEHQTGDPESADAAAWR
jgi:hypothetical protein